MKSIRDIENMSLEQLEAVSLDESVVVPDGFVTRIKETIESAEKVGYLTEDESGIKSSRKTVRYVAAAASVVIMAGAGFGIAQRQSQPKDTFDDPYLAYAELEKVFAKVSDGIQKGLAMVGESEAAMDKVSSIFE